MCVFCVFCVSPDRGVYDGPITRPEESYCLRCFQMSVIEEPYGGGLGSQGLSIRVKRQYYLNICDSSHKFLNV
jgi:hypothetical protein